MTTLLEPRTAARSDYPAYPSALGLPRQGAPRLVEVPDRHYLAVLGTAAPGSPEFQDAIGALYGVSYGLHFLLRARGSEAPIGHLEALWDRRDGSSPWDDEAAMFDPEAWRWTLLMELPEEAASEDITAAIATARRKHPSPALDRLFVLDHHEGLVVEAMHIGPYATEPDTIARMRATAAAAGLKPRGPHHEIYLGDPKRTALERLRTVLRQPVA